MTDDFKEQLKGKSKQNSSKIFLGKYQIYTADNKGKDKRLQAYRWRVEALSKQLTIEEVAFVICEINGLINNSSGYLGSISDRSKDLVFNKQTVGQALMNGLIKDPHYSLKNQVYYRQDYMDEFEAIWETQAKYHSELTPELKKKYVILSFFISDHLKVKRA